MDVVQHQLVAAAEARLGAGRLGLKNAPAELSEALKQTFASETTVDLQQVTSKLEMAFSLDPTLRGATAEIAAELQERIYREYMATTAPKVLVAGSLDSPAGVISRSTSHRQMVLIPGTNLESLGADALYSPPLGASPAAAAKRASLAVAATLSMTHLWADAEAALLQATGLASAVSLMELPDPQLVSALWRLVPPTPLASSHPLLIIYTSGTSGFRPRGLVCDTGGYCSGLAHTMRLAFDVRPADVVLVDASPSWITGQSYGVAGPLLCRATSVFVPPGELVDDDLPAFLAAGRRLARSNPSPSPRTSHPPTPQPHDTHVAACVVRSGSGARRYGLQGERLLLQAPLATQVPPGVASPAEAEQFAPRRHLVWRAPQSGAPLHCVARALPQLHQLVLEHRTRRHLPITPIRQRRRAAAPGHAHAANAVGAGADLAATQP